MQQSDTVCNRWLQTAVENRMEQIGTVGTDACASIVCAVTACAVTFCAKSVALVCRQLAPVATTRAINHRLLSHSKRTVV